LIEKCPESFECYVLGFKGGRGTGVKYDVSLGYVPWDFCPREYSIRSLCFSSNPYLARASDGKDENKIYTLILS